MGEYRKGIMYVIIESDTTIIIIVIIVIIMRNVWFVYRGLERTILNTINASRMHSCISLE